MSASLKRRSRRCLSRTLFKEGLQDRQAQTGKKPSWKSYLGRASCNTTVQRSQKIEADIKVHTSKKEIKNSRVFLHQICLGSPCSLQAETKIYRCNFLELGKWEVFCKFEKGYSETSPRGWLSFTWYKKHKGFFLRHENHCWGIWKQKDDNWRCDEDANKMANIQAGVDSH